MRHALRHIAEYHDLQARLGPIVGDVRIAFFGLSPSDLTQLFEIYETQYGSNAGNYARATFDKWRTGATHMSGQTAARLLNLVPHFLTFAQRYQMVSKLCDHFSTKKRVQVTILLNNPLDGLSELNRHINDFSNIALLKYIPQHVLDTVTWLNDNDVTAARALLSQIEKNTSDYVKHHAGKELPRILALAKNKQTTLTSQTIEFPNGTIEITFRKPSLFERLFG
jgi:hypothetical protein